MKTKRLRIADGLRKEVFSQTSGACYYCGYAATDIDHIIPYSYIVNNSESNLIPCCSICNSIAGNKHFGSLQEKRNYILSERDTLKWRRRLSRMIVTVVSPEVSSMPQSEKESKKIETTRRLITATPPDIQIESSVKQAIPENKQSESKPIHKIYQEPEYVEDDEDDEECVYSKDDPEEFIFSLPSEEFDAIMKAAVKREHSIEIEQETFDYLCAEAEWREMSGPGAVVDWLIAKEIEEQIATAEWGMREPETK